MSLSTSRAYMPTHNQRVVLNLVRTEGPISRADIVRLSGLTFPSVSRIVGELIERGLVAEKRQRRGGMGKPPTELEMTPRSAFSVGLDLDRDGLTAVLVDLAGGVLARERIAFTDLSAEAVLPLMTQATETLLGGQDVSRRLLLGIGVGLPAPLTAGDVASLPGDKLPGWDDAGVAAALGKTFGCPVLLENNAAAAAIGERWYGVGQGLKDFFYVFFGYGVGGGVVLGGRPHAGFRGFSGEFGHIPVQRSGDGGHDAGYGTGHDAGRDTGLYAAPGELAKRLAEAGADAADLGGLLAAGHPVVLEWLDTAANVLAPALVTTEYILDPEAFVFGGRLPAELTDALIERLSECLPRHRHPAKGYGPQLLRGRTGDDAAAFGAASIPVYRAMTPDPIPDGTYRSAVAQGY